MWWFIAGYSSPIRNNNTVPGLITRRNSSRCTSSNQPFCGVLSAGKTFYEIVTMTSTVTVIVTPTPTTPPTPTVTPTPIPTNCPSLGTYTITLSGWYKNVQKTIMLFTHFRANYTSTHAELQYTSYFCANCSPSWFRNCSIHSPVVAILPTCRIGKQLFVCLLVGV